eukprot:12568770-Ditylum_brightwellii.AAC.1
MAHNLTRGMTAHLSGMQIWRNLLNNQMMLSWWNKQTKQEENEKRQKTSQSKANKANLPSRSSLKRRTKENQPWNSSKSMARKH